MPSLYRQYDAQNKLLYIGSAISLAPRFKAHEGQSPWFPLVSRVDVQHFEDIGAAKLAERDAIISEKPLFNVQHNPRSKGDGYVSVRGKRIGRRPDIVYSLEQAETFLRFWFEVPRLMPAEVNARIEGILELPPGTLSNQWIKDLCVKYTGSAKRVPPKNWDGIQVDADGRNVRYWEKEDGRG